MRVWATQNLNYEHKYAGVMLSKMRAIWLEVTIKGNLISVLSHNDPNTKTGVNMGRGVQQKTHKYIIFFFLLFFFKKNTNNSTITSLVGSWVRAVPGGA